MTNLVSRLLRAARSLSDAALMLALTGGAALEGRALHRRVRGSPSPAERLAGKTVLVTGASRGIGRAVALEVAEAAATVLLVARSDEKLRALALEVERRGGAARVYTADLSSTSSAAALLARLEEEGTQVDVLINALNDFGSLRLILGLLPGMRARQSGHVINVSSAGVPMGTQLFSAYVASKAALDEFTRVIAEEALGDGVAFTTVHMPLVRTPMIAPTAVYREVAALTPEQAAEVVLRAIATRERQVGTRLARGSG
jgi:short-subunit dehydrogenase